MHSRSVFALLAFGISPFGLLVSVGGSAAAPDAPQGMFALYEKNRQEGLPNFITEDYLLLAYSMIRQQTMLRHEEEVLMPGLEELVSGIRGQFKEAGDEPDKANLDFMAILEALLEGKQVPSKEGDEKSARAELDLIVGAAGIAPSPLWGMAMDYSQLAPRGPYTQTEQGKRYFRGMRYVTSVLFAVKESQATGVSPEMADRMTAQAMNLAEIIRRDEKLASLYSSMDKGLGWSQGPADDLTLDDLTSVISGLEKGGGRKPEVSRVRQALFEHARSHGRQPRIISGLVRKDALEQGLSPADVLTGWRFLPQRYTPESAAMQALVYDRVTDYQGARTPFGLTVMQGKPVKGFPSGLELMALLGSEKARRVIAETDETNFKGYMEACSAALAEVSTGQGLSQLHMGLLRTWLSARREGLPDEARRLESCLSFWTWQRYLGILYAKQSTTVLGKGMILLKERPRAWIEPAVELYLALSHLAARHRAVTPEPAWETFGTILDRCLAISWRELAGILPGKEDSAFLNELDTELKHLTGGEDHPIVVDVHTEPNSKLVVEEATGWPRAVWKPLGEGISARGALFTHHEFKHPMDDRLTDEKWEDILKKKCKQELTTKSTKKHE